MIGAFLAAIGRLFHWFGDLFTRQRSGSVDAGAIIRKADEKRRADEKERKRLEAEEHRRLTDKARADLKTPPATAKDMVKDSGDRVRKHLEDKK